MRRPAFLVAALIVGGCSLITSLDGYTGGASVQASLDAAPALDAEAGPTDASAPPPSPTQDFCSTFAKAPRFCTDFSSGATVGNNGTFEFDYATQKSGGQAAVLDTSVFATAAPAARFGIPGGGKSHLSRYFPGEAPGVLELGMSMRVGAGAETNDLMEVRLGVTDSWKAALFVRRQSDGTLELWEAYELTDGGGEALHWPLTRTMPADTWTRMVWRIDATGITVTVDGALALQEALKEPPVPSTGITVVAGCTDTTKDSTVWIDDVYMDF